MKGLAFLPKRGGGVDYAGTEGKHDKRTLPPTPSSWPPLSSEMIKSLS